MARVTIDNSILLSNFQWIHSGHVAVKDATTAYVFGIDNSSNDCSYWKTTDSGQTWAGPTTWGNGSAGSTSCSIYYEKWNGTAGRDIVHLLRFQDFGTRGTYYRQLNLTTDTFSTEVFVQADGGAINSHCSVAISRDFSLLLAHGNGRGDGSQATRKSTDDGATWSDCVSIQDNPGFDEYEIWPDFSSSDPQDMAVVYWATSGNDFVLKQVDISANSITTTNIVTTLSASGFNDAWGVCLAPSGALCLAAWNIAEVNGSANELKTFLINGSTITPMTSVISGVSYAYSAAVSAITGVGIVVHYTRDGAGASGSSMEIYYKISTDGMATWGAEQTYDSTAGTTWLVLSSPVIPGGGLALAAWADGAANALYTAYPPVIDTTPTPPVTGTIPPTNSNPSDSQELDSNPSDGMTLDSNPSDDQMLDSNPSDGLLLDSNPSDAGGLSA